MKAAASISFDAAEIGLRATLSPDPGGGRALRLSAHISAQDVVLVHESSEYSGELRLAIVGYSQGSEPKVGPVIPFDLHLSAQDYGKVLQQGIEIVQNIVLPEAIRTVRLIVFDRASNAVGSVTLPVSAVPMHKPD